MHRALLLAAVLLVPHVAAWDDAADDHEAGYTYAYVDGERQMHWTEAAPLGWYPEADVLSATVSETQDDIIFEVERAGVDGSPTEPHELFAAYYAFEFTLRDQPMVGVFHNYMDDFLSDFQYFFVGMADEASYLGVRITSSWEAEVTDTTLRVEFPKTLFRDDDFVPLREGDELKDIRFGVTTDDFPSGIGLAAACPGVDTGGPSLFLSLCAWQARDAMQGGDVLGSFEVQETPEGVGHLLLRGERPFRLSNGLATTFLYNVQMHNFDNEADEILLTAVEVPKGWEVLHPAKVSFDSAGVKDVPVAVTVPFVHQHGNTERFLLQAASQKAPDVEAATSMGIIYADPPQPGGHHSRLYLHADNNQFFSYGWLNTDKEPGPEEGDRLMGRYQGDQVGPIGGVPTSVHWEWHLPLQPRLAVGLDFDTSGAIRATLPIEAAWNVEGQVTADLMIAGRETVSIAEMTTDVSLQSGQTTEVELTGQPTTDADRIELDAGNLYLSISLDGVVPPEQTPGPILTSEAALLTDGFELELPLLDFHEEVDLDGLFLNSFTISGNRTFTAVNPGKTAAFVFNVTNVLSQQQTLTWELSGANADWARLSPAQTLVPGSGVGRVAVEVTPPSSAVEGDTAELLLLGTAKEDPDRQVFIRMTAYVTTDDDIPDESHVVDEVSKSVEKQNEDLGNDSPAFNAIASMALLLAIGLVLRRRR